MDNERQGNGLAVVFAFFLGSLFGALLSLLFAPITGRETREKIRSASIDAKERSIEAAHRVREATRERITDVVDQGRARVDDAAGNVKAAVEAGKTAFLGKKADLVHSVSEESGEEEVEPNEEDAVS
ncbi:MAG: YtxH domain-containing protein [Candidatus Poribacteria bacterium]|nr:YtxH domain-containing protein [Candidatus Poribacteria bacterium]